MNRSYAVCPSNEAMNSWAWLWYPTASPNWAATSAAAFSRSAMSLTPSSVIQRSAGTKGSITVLMPIFAAASKTTSGLGVGIEPSGVHSSSDSSGACPVGEARPAASRAVRISSGRRTKSKASTFFSPIAASRSSEPFISAENCSARV